MPILWRYLLSQYLKVLALCVLSFIALLLTSRLQEIAQFATMGTKWSTLTLFTLFQIPYILPIAIPIACVISATLLFGRLSHTNELTAMRSGGLSLPHILAPILFTSALLSLANFYIASELATSAHLATRRMVHDISSINPLTLLKNAKISQLSGAYVHIDPVKSGENARNVLIAIDNRSQDSMQLLVCKEIKVGQGEIIGRNVSFIAPQEKSLVIENQALMKTDAATFSHFVRKKGWKVAWDHLKLSYLRLRLSSEKSPKGYSEIARRSALGIAPFTFTLLGAAFGVEIGRRHSKRGLVATLFLAATTLIAFFVAKELDHLLLVALILYFAPHLLITLSSLRRLRRTVRGIE